MKKLLLLSMVSLFLLTGCRQTGCNQEYFQSVSSIVFPEGAEMTVCVDNLEWTVQAVFQLPDQDIEEFIVKNDFQPVTNSDAPDSFSFFLLPEVHRQFPDADNLYAAIGSTDRELNWYYLLDKKSGRLWAQINYPDRSGN
jgi:nitrous oxide reductase accessory protein NosL